jgi:hypothetical protein
MDGLRDEMIEDIYGINPTCEGCICETCLRKSLDEVEPCYANCCLGFPQCMTFSCEYYLE